MYPDHLEEVESNYTSRKSRVDGINHVVQFGLQAWLRDLQKNWNAFFATPKEEAIQQYKDTIETFVSPDFTYDHVEALHDLGYLPIRFEAVPEGTLVPIGVPAILIKSTHKDFAWLVNYLESDLSAGIWHPQTVATIAWNLRRIFEKASEVTGGPKEAVDWQLHDFSYRGQVNREAAASSGAAHLLSFFGSDAVVAVPWVKSNYPGNNGLIAASVPATEHSVMCAYGRANEIDAFENQLDRFPTGILSVVSDTYSLRQVIEDFLPKLKEKIVGRDGKLVIRPDSGDPADIICGTEREFGKGEDFYAKGAIEALWDEFGGTVNEKGFKVLSEKIGLIYGDGMFADRIKDINARLAAKGFASTNLVAGIGSYSYQMVTRDTFGSAVKATFVVVDGDERNIQKDPETDDGTKKSATGRLAVGTNQNTGDLYLIQEAEPWQIENSRLLPVWENGEFIREYSYADVRARLKTNTEVLVRSGVLV